MRHGWLAGAIVIIGCGSSGGGDTTLSGSGDATATETEATTTPTSSGSQGTDSTSMGSTDEGPIFDVAGETESNTTVGQPSCKVEDDMNAPGACRMEAPPDSFDPDIQWIWEGPPDEHQSIVTPLVANFTDDNDDGEIDLCDIPDVLVVTYDPIYVGGHISLLDGETGAVHFEIPELVQERICPAIGDIDDDGLPEIITFTWSQSNGSLIAFEHDGTVKWQQAAQWLGNSGPSLALADLDLDGDIEILAGRVVMDHDGNVVWQTADSIPYYAATTAADLDNDDDLEVVIGQVAYHHDGSPYYSTALAGGFPQVADLDDDPEPEILHVGNSGVSVIEHNGAIKYQGMSPSGDPPNWYDRPATVHDFDGDGDAEAAASSATHYTLFEADASPVWIADVLDSSGIAAGTAFDFLGDGVAEAMYGDESTMFVFDGTGQPLLQIPRTSWTTTEYPIVVDVDNDGSAEIVVVSNEKGGASPTVQVIRDVQDRWIQARRIWNQHTYHVSNVREDSTIPSPEPHHWELLNTFRTNAQIEGGVLCIPDPEG